MGDDIIILPEWYKNLTRKCYPECVHSWRWRTTVTVFCENCCYGNGPWKDVNYFERRKRMARDPRKSGRRGVESTAGMFMRW